MFRKVIVLCLAVFLVYVTHITAHAEEKSPNRIVSEKFIDEIDPSKWIPQSLTISPDGKRMTYVALVKGEWCVIVNGEKSKTCIDAGGEPLTFLPGRNDVAFVVTTSDGKFKWVDAKYWRQYGGISTPIFSPDSEHVVYVAQVGNKQFVVVDGEEGKRYDGIWPIPNIRQDKKNISILSKYQ